MTEAGEVGVAGDSDEVGEDGEDVDKTSSASSFVCQLEHKLVIIIDFKFVFLGVILACCVIDALYGDDDDEE